MCCSPAIGLRLLALGRKQELHSNARSGAPRRRARARLLGTTHLALSCGRLPVCPPAAAGGHKGKEFASEEEQAAYLAQRRRERQALKQQLDDMHMT